MYAVEFETINNNGMLKIPNEFNTFENNELLRVIILKDNQFIKNKQEVKDIFDDYQLNGEKNFIPFEDGNKELDDWLDSLDENSKIQ